MKTALPPLDLLAPFETAARHGSFTKAASELNVTQSAVSQRVRTLEDCLGVALFDRTHRRISLTAAGRELLNGTTVALGHLRAATESVRRSEALPRVKMAADSSIADFWLMPRLARFRDAYPEAAVDLTVSDRETECLAAEIAILHGAGDWPGFESTRLFGDEIFPVCAPGYLERRPIRSADDLATADLIDLDYAHWNWMNWSIWLTEQGVEAAAAKRFFQSNSYQAVIAAARHGQGVALGWRHFIDADLESGRLVRPIPERVTTAFGYFIALRSDAQKQARTFARWLICSRPGHDPSTNCQTGRSAR